MQNNIFSNNKKMDKELGKLSQAIRNLENPRNKKRGSHNRHMKNAFNLALEYGYPWEKFGKRGYNLRDKVGVTEFLYRIYVHSIENDFNTREIVLKTHSALYEARPPVKICEGNRF